MVSKKRGRNWLTGQKDGNGRQLALTDRDSCLSGGVLRMTGAAAPPSPQPLDLQKKRDLD